MDPFDGRDGDHWYGWAGVQATPVSGVVIEGRDLLVGVDLNAGNRCPPIRDEPVAVTR